MLGFGPTLLYVNVYVNIKSDRYIYMKIVFTTVANLKGCRGELAAGRTRLCGKGQGGRDH
jgi:hypothetical protein